MKADPQMVVANSGHAFRAVVSNMQTKAGCPRRHRRADMKPCFLKGWDFPAASGAARFADATSARTGSCRVNLTSKASSIPSRPRIISVMRQPNSALRKPAADKPRMMPIEGPAPKTAMTLARDLDGNLSASIDTEGQAGWLPRRPGTTCRRGCGKYWRQTLLGRWPG